MVAEMLEALDLKEINPNRMQRALSWLRHAVLGCDPEPHYIGSGGRLIETGRICPVCWVSTPSMTERQRPVREPAVAVAISRCIDFQLGDGAAFARHPGPCRFCAVPLDAKLDVVREFNIWSGTDAVAQRGQTWDERTSRYQPVVEAFMRLPAEEQTRLVDACAAYTTGIPRRGRVTAPEAPGGPA